MAVFNLYAVVVYLFCSLALLYFLCRQKVPKSLALGRSSRLLLLFVNCFAISLSRRKLVVQACSQIFWRSGTCAVIAFKGKYNATALQTDPRLLQNICGLSLFHLRCRFFLDITFANGNPRVLLGEHIGSPLRLFRVYGFIFRVL